MYHLFSTISSLSQSDRDTRQALNMGYFSICISSELNLVGQYFHPYVQRPIKRRGAILLHRSSPGVTFYLLMSLVSLNPVGKMHVSFAMVIYSGQMVYISGRAVERLPRVFTGVRVSLPVQLSI